MASRMSKTWLIPVILIIAILALVGIALSCSSSSPSEALDFTLPTLTGANITLSGLEGTPVVINFWSIGCSWCKYQLPFLESVAQQREGEITVIVINFAQDASTVQSFVQDFFGKNETTMIVALDGDRGVFVNYCQNYGNSGGGIPFTLFVDSEGLIQYRRIGAFSSEAELWNTLHSVLGITVP